MFAILLFQKTIINDLPTGVSLPSFSLKTISVWPLIKNLGGLLHCTEPITHIKNTHTSVNRSDICLNRTFTKCPLNVRTFLFVICRSVSMFCYFSSSAHFGDVKILLLSHELICIFFMVKDLLRD